MGFVEQVAHRVNDASDATRASGNCSAVYFCFQGKVEHLDGVWVFVLRCGNSLEDPREIVSRLDGQTIHLARSCSAGDLKRPETKLIRKRRRLKLGRAGLRDCLFVGNVNSRPDEQSAHLPLVSAGNRGSGFQKVEKEVVPLDVRIRDHEGKTASSPTSHRVNPARDTGS